MTTEIKFEKEQARRILTGFYFLNRSIEEIAQNLVSSKRNEFNCTQTLQKAISALVSEKKDFRRKEYNLHKHKPADQAKWIHKPDHESIVTEDDLFEIPLPPEFRLQYTLQSSMNDE